MYISLQSNIFHSFDDLLEFILDHEILPNEKICERCGYTTRLVVYRQGRSQRLIFRCKARICQAKRPIFRTALPLTSYVHLVYLLLSDASYRQLNWWYGFANTTISSCKQKLREIYKKYVDDRPVYLGGPGLVVEVDETVLSRRGVIRSPTSTSDTTADTVWIVGAIDNTPSKNFFLKRVENRKVNTLTNVLDGVIRVGSLLYTDGYPSYPRVADNLTLEHHVVNHSEGFIAHDGTHTNNQEGFWSHLKGLMRKENGVQRSNIDTWLDEYIFKRRYFLNATKEEFSRGFIDILKYLLND